MGKNWIGCSAVNFHKGRPGGLKPAAIVVHIMDGTLTGTDAWFSNPKSSVSAHYGVGKTGVVHQYVEEQDTAFHAGTVVNPTWTGIRKGVNPNFYTIGIEHEGTAAEQWPWPDDQLKSTAALIAEVAARWNIPLDTDHVIPHHAIRASKTCPGNDVLLDHIVDMARAATPEKTAPIPHNTELQILQTVNVRFQQPTTSARIVRVLPPTSRATAVAYTISGERIDDNPNWYQDAEGNYLWAGATDLPHPA